MDAGFCCVFRSSWRRHRRAILQLRGIVRLVWRMVCARQQPVGCPLDVASHLTVCLRQFCCGPVARVSMSDGLLSNEERASVVEYVVQKRTASFDYMKRAYEGEMHWMSTVKIPTSGLVAYYSHKDMAKRVQEWFCLGVSLAEIVKMPNR